MQIVHENYIPLYLWMPFSVMLASPQNPPRLSKVLGLWRIPTGRLNECGEAKYERKERRY